MGDLVLFRRQKATYVENHKIFPPRVLNAPLRGFFVKAVALKKTSVSRWKLSYDMCIAFV